MVKLLLCFLFILSLDTEVFSQPMKIAVGDDVVVGMPPPLKEFGVCLNPREQCECDYSIYNILIQSPFYPADSGNIRFKADSVALYSDTARYYLFNSYLSCSPPNTCYFCRSHTEYKFYQVMTYLDNKIKMFPHFSNSLINGKFADSDVAFHYDTTQKSYSGAVSLLKIYNNKKTKVFFDSWVLAFDSSRSISFILYQDSSQISNVEVAAESVAKNLIFHFTTTLVPAIPWRSYPGVVQCTAHFGGKDSLCSIPLTFMFQYMPKSGVSSENTLNELEVYPNPSTGSFKLSCILLKSSQLHLHIFDELGKDFMTVHEGILSEGPHNFSFKLPSGMYYARMETAEGVVTKKIVVE